MSKTLGGKREGAGRKPGIPNKDRREFIALIENIGGTEDQLGKLKELANGVTCVRHEKDGNDVVYERPPDSFAITWMLDQAYGKAKQHVEVETEGGYEDFLVQLGCALATAGCSKVARQDNDGCEVSQRDVPIDRLQGAPRPVEVQPPTANGVGGEAKAGARGQAGKAGHTQGKARGR